jgi:hypothetical protein
LLNFAFGFEQEGMSFFKVSSVIEMAALELAINKDTIDSLCFS